MHKTVELPIYYFGAPVILISTLNEDGSVNLAPSSSIWWLGKSCMVGLEGSSKTTENLRRTGQCVINLMSDGMADNVHRLSRATGSKSVPLHKKAIGYTFVKDKATKAGFTLEPSMSVEPPKVSESQVQIEARVKQTHPFSDAPIPMFAFEMSIEHCHIEEDVLMGENNQYVDPDKWNPLIFKFGQYYSTNQSVHSYSIDGNTLEKYRFNDPKGALGRLMARSVSWMYRKYS